MDRYYSPVEGRVHLTGIFADRTNAETAVSQLESLGVPRADISVVYRDQRDNGAVVNTGNSALEGAGAGSAVGGTVGAILGAIAATATSVVVPGIGVLIAGPIAGALAGAGAGGLTGGLVGALVGAGVPEEDARTYESRINEGGVLVIADVPSSIQDSARAILGA